MSTHESRQDQKLKKKPDFSQLTPEEQSKISHENASSDEQIAINEFIAEEAAKKFDEERSKRSFDQIPPEAL